MGPSLPVFLVAGWQWIFGEQAAFAGKGPLIGRELFIHDTLGGEQELLSHTGQYISGEQGTLGE